MIDKHPDVVMKVARGIAKAVHFGFANPDAAVKIHWKAYPQTKPQGDDEAALMRDAKKIFMARFSGFALDVGQAYGESKPAQWAKLADFMKKTGALPASYDPANAFTSQFIADINKFDRAAIDAQAKAWKE